PKQASTQVAGDVEVLLPLAGLIDVEEEQARLQKEINKVQKDVDFFNKKLSNEKFVANAPPQVLQKDRRKLSAAEGKRAILQQSLEKILALK
ncbi:MAG: valine--tRNA ligase, partial [Desulfuromonadaceae bacterium]|nr:valine--tRNA ligase [Desulfuromonadaceae bacterium]